MLEIESRLRSVGSHEEGCERILELTGVSQQHVESLGHAAVALGEQLIERRTAGRLGGVELAAPRRFLERRLAEETMDEAEPLVGRPDDLPLHQALQQALFMPKVQILAG